MPGVGGVENGAVDDHITDPPETVAPGEYSHSPLRFSPLNLSSVCASSLEARVGTLFGLLSQWHAPSSPNVRSGNPSWVIVSTLARLKEGCKENFARVGLSLPSSASVLRSPVSVSIPHRDRQPPDFGYSTPRSFRKKGKTPFHYRS